jgi:hypothetical protein
MPCPQARHAFLCEGWWRVSVLIFSYRYARGIAVETSKTSLEHRAEKA